MAPYLRLARDKRRRPFWRTQRLLGKTFIDKQQEGILAIGKDVWTRQEIVDDLHCGNFVAAQNLTKVARKLQVDSLEELTRRYSLEDLFAETGVGLTTMFVLMCAQEARRRDPLKWLDTEPNAFVTLSTVKHRVIQQQHARAAATRTARRKPA